MQSLSRTETVLLSACAALFGFALTGPALPHPADYHAFADRRMWLGVPFAMDVLSNLPFAWMGAWGLLTLKRLPACRPAPAERTMARIFFHGLLVTAAASAWYHLHPDDAGLAIDRGGMALAFAGLLGLAAAGRVSARAGQALGLAVLVLAPLAVRCWSATGNVLPWAVMQFGGMGLMLWFACLRPRAGALAVPLGAIVLAYAVAKLFELQDHTVFALTGGAVSGHTLKHLAAALAALPVIAALHARRPAGHNARENAARAPAGTRTA